MLCNVMYIYIFYVLYSFPKSMCGTEMSPPGNASQNLLKVLAMQTER